MALLPAASPTRMPSGQREDSRGDGSKDSEDTNGHVSNGSPLPPHPLGIKPLGNKYFSTVQDARAAVGTFQVLPDEVLMQFLEYLDQRSLRLLGYTCKFLFAFCNYEELWKALFLESQGQGPQPRAWRGTWRSTLLHLPEGQEVRVDCSNVFSDVLHRPFVCTHLPLAQYASGIPDANQIRRFEELPYTEFAEKWSNSPFILTRCIQPWPVLNAWNIDSLLKQYPDVEFRAEAVDWPFSTYCQYMRNNQDESPLYLFDRMFAEKMDIKVGKDSGASYWRPDCFGPDLFELLGPERPAHRWLIIGPERSGSTFHKDPNATSAWNAVIQGAKYWIMFPPSVAVPGVYVSKDKSEVTSPLSIAEWLLEFHKEARQLPECVEGICRRGEILHVPSGWWHLVVNLEPGIALTQNFVPKAHLPEVLSFLRDRPEQVTGFKKEVHDPYALFTERLREECAGYLEEALLELERRNSRKKRTWQNAVGADGDGKEGRESGGFTFGFGFVEDDGDDDDEEMP